MAVELTSLEFTSLYILTILLLIVKLILSFYLLRRILKDKKEKGQISYNFVFSFFILMLCLFFSRLIYFYNFNLSKFDPDKYYLFPYYVYWKIASIVGMVGLAYLVFIIDKQAFKFKFKGILAYILIAGMIFIAVYPINSLEDFRLVSYVFISVSIVGALIPILFIYIGIKTPPIRKYAYLFSLGVILYLISINLVTESTLAPLREIYGSSIHVIMYFIYFVLKVIGLSISAYYVNRLI
ncbi:MAG: hypothetical protein ACFFAO_18180 [Candidatus Hermodarchaeota archaeon]